MEKKLFYPDYDGELKDITENDITHKNLDYSSFLKELLKKDCFLLKQTQKDVGKYGKLFISHIQSKKFWKILKWMNHWNLYLKEINYKDRVDALEKWLYSFQYLSTEEKVNGKRTKKGLYMPVFGLPRCEIVDNNGNTKYSIVDSLKKAQKRYETYELLRILTTFERMVSETESHEHFFNSYINRLTNKFFEYRKNELGSDIKRKTKITEYLLKILKDIYKKEEDLDIIKKLLDEREYDKAHKQYEDDYNERTPEKSKCKTHNKFRVEQCFAFLQSSNEEEFSEILEATKHYETWLGQDNCDNQISISEEPKSIEYERLSKVLNGDNDFNELLLKCIKTKKRKNKNLNNGVLTEIKQTIVRYSLTWNTILDDKQLEEIKGRICKEYSDFEYELFELFVKKYPLVRRKMQDELKPFYNSRL